MAERDVLRLFNSTHVPVTVVIANGSTCFVSFASFRKTPEFQEGQWGLAITHFGA